MKRHIRGTLFVASAVVLVAAVGLVVTGCENLLDGENDTTLPAEDGTVTVRVTNVGDAPAGSGVAVYVYEAGAHSLDTDSILAMGWEKIGTESSVEVLLETLDDWAPSGDAWTASGGEEYDAYIYTTHDDDNYDFTPDSRITSPFPELLAVDGDTTVNLDYVSEMVDATFLTVEIHDDHNDIDLTHFAAMVFESGEELSAESRIAAGWDAFEDDSILVQIEYFVPDELVGVWVGNPGKTYPALLTVSPEGSIKGGPAAPGSYTRYTEVEFDASGGHVTVFMEFKADNIEDEFIMDIEFDQWNPEVWYGPAPE